MTQPQDDPMRDEFQRLRAETEASGHGPDFQAMMDRAKAEAAPTPELVVVRGERADTGAFRRRRRIVWVGGWASVALAAAIAGILLIGEETDRDVEFDRLIAAYASDASAGAWRSPTSALLNVPGMDLTRSVPSIGGAVRGLDPSRLPNIPDSERRDS